ncbi:MAG: hypothetical protein H0W55_12510 [Actinobacteria bacterium]|nr:hypothetical protein [Actinomycetota bacterium]
MFVWFVVLGFQDEVFPWGGHGERFTSGNDPKMKIPGVLSAPFNRRLPRRTKVDDAVIDRVLARVANIHGDLCILLHFDTFAPEAPYTFLPFDSRIRPPY